MAVTLTTAAKNWLATNAGVNNCFSHSGVTYIVDGTSRTGSTGDAVNAFYVSHLLGLDTTVVTAGMDYAGLKAINGGADLTMGSNVPGVIDGDVKFAYANDGATYGISAYCVAPANIVSTALTLSTTSCTTPCNVTGSASWRNDGAIAGTLNPAILINGVSTSVGSSETINPGQTITHGFSLPAGLVAGTYIVCASPGTHCQTVTVGQTPTDIVATDITLTPDTTACVAPCGMTVDVTWTNNGGTAGTFVPNITINGNEINPVYSSESLAGLSSVTRSFLVSNLLSGNHTICAYPNPTSLACKTITVNASASFTSNPSEADVYIDGSSTSSGMTPVTVTNLSVGNHTYRLTNDACDNERTGSFTIPVGETTVDVPYITINGSAHFTSAPSQARIWIDGVDTGVDTPDDVLDLTPGDHTFELRRAGYENFTGDFTVTLCQRHDHELVNLVQAAAEAGIGGIMMLGLAVGALLMKNKKI